MSDLHCNLLQVLALTYSRYSFMHSFSLKSDSFKAVEKPSLKADGKSVAYWQPFCLSLMGSCATHVVCVKYILSGVWTEVNMNARLHATVQDLPFLMNCHGTS